MVVLFAQVLAVRRYAVWPPWSMLSSTASAPSARFMPAAPSHGVAGSRRFCTMSTLRVPFPVTRTGGSICGYGQKAQGQMFAGKPAVAGKIRRSMATLLR